MAGQKRAKELAAAKQQRQQQRREAQRRKNRWIAVVSAVVAVAAVLAVVFLASRNSQDQPSSTGSASAGSTPGNADQPITGINCEPATPDNATGSYPTVANVNLAPGSAMTLDTNCGVVTFSLDVMKAPQSTNALAFLADKGWYNNSNCPRLVVAGIFVVQCGAGDTNGFGDPGFTVPDENLPIGRTPGPVTYPRGTVAMANRGPNTSNSQFFIVYKDSVLAPDYSIIGRVTEGLDVIEYVAAQGVSDGATSQSDGPPAQPLVIKTATVRNGP